MPSKSGRLKVLSTILIYGSVPPPSLCVLQISSTLTPSRDRGTSHTLRAQSPKTAPSSTCFTRTYTQGIACASSDWPATDGRFPRPPPWISNMSHKVGFPHPLPWWKRCVGQSMRKKYGASTQSSHALSRCAALPEPPCPPTWKLSKQSFGVLWRLHRHNWLNHWPLATGSTSSPLPPLVLW